MGLFDLGARADALPIPAAVLGALSDDERTVLVLLKQNGRATTSELAGRLGKNPGRLKGLMVRLRRRLHGQGLMVFDEEALPTGESSFVWVGGS